MNRVSRAESEPSSPRAGLTLIEVLLAVVILGAGMAILLTSISRCLAVIRAARTYQTAQWVLGLGELDHPLLYTNELEEINVSPDTYDNGFTFSREVEEEDPDEDHLYLVRTRVSWTEQKGERFEEVVSCIYVPEDNEITTGPSDAGAGAGSGTAAGSGGTTPVTGGSGIQPTTGRSGNSSGRGRRSSVTTPGMPSIP